MQDEQAGKPIKDLRDANLIGEDETGLLVDQRCRELITLCNEHGTHLMPTRAKDRTATPDVSISGPN